jgi:YbbR domain-containing protein
VPVKVKTSGELAPGLILQRIGVNPDSIEVLAPRKLRKIGLAIQTEPIDLTKVLNSTTLTPKLVFPSDIRFTNEKPPSVKLTIEIRSKSAQGSREKKS